MRKRYRTKNDKKRFMAVETWENEAALDGHKNSEHYKIYKSSYEPYTVDKYTDELDFLVTIS